MEPKKNFWLCRLGFVADENYFNSGVLLININALKSSENIFYNACDFVRKYPDCRLFDQDVLNHCFSSRALKLPAEFNSFIRWERHQKRGVENKMYHFVGTFLGDGLNFDLNDPFNKLYFSYFAKTPWFGLETLDNISKALEEVNKTQRASTLNMIRLLGKRDRAFFTEHNNIPAVKALFEVDDKELVIDASNSDALMKALIALNHPAGQRKKIIFIFSGNYLAFRDFLRGQQFVEGVDFVNAMPFVSNLLGIPTESHSIVRAL